MAPNDYNNGNVNESQVIPAMGESGRPTPHTLTAVRVRQGVISGRIVKILGISLSLAILAMVLSYLVAF